MARSGSLLMMRRRRSVAIDVEGAEGFMEAVLAIMVISIAMALVFYAVPRTGAFGDGWGDLREEAEELRDRILALASDDGMVLEGRSLYKLKDLGIGMMRGQGMRAELRLLGGASVVLPLACSGNLPARLDECFVLRHPACYSLDGSVVQAASLVVMVW